MLVILRCAAEEAALRLLNEPQPLAILDARCCRAVDRAGVDEHTKLTLILSRRELTEVMGHELVNDLLRRHDAARDAERIDLILQPREPLLAAFLLPLEL